MSFSYADENRENASVIDHNVYWVRRQSLEQPESPHRV